MEAAVNREIHLTDSKEVELATRSVRYKYPRRLSIRDREICIEHLIRTSDIKHFYSRYKYAAITDATN